jgi:hypothetical protein
MSWEDLTTVEQVYWAIALPATLIFVILLVITIVGGGSDHVDVDSDADAEGAGTGFQFITVKNLIGFFTVFGWSGLSCLDAGLDTNTTVLVSSLSGLAMMVAMAAVFYFMSKLSHSGTMKMERAVGAVGEVYITIPGKRNGMGKVQVRMQGALRELEAMTDEESEIRTGKMVSVEKIIGEEILLVKSLNK